MKPPTLSLLVTEAEFYLLLQRYLDGRCTPAEQARVAQWYDQLQGQAAEDARPLPSQQQAVEAAIWQRLRRPPQRLPPPQRTPTCHIRRRDITTTITNSSST